MLARSAKKRSAIAAFEDERSDRDLCETAGTVEAVDDQRSDNILSSQSRQQHGLSASSEDHSADYLLRWSAFRRGCAMRVTPETCGT